MPRVPRLIVPGVVYHLIARFVDRQWFITNDEERALYIRLLGCAVRASDWRCLAYAVMSNHVHLAVIAGRERLDSWIRRVHSPFADFMNAAQGRIGPLFARGPKSRPVSPERVGDVIAYIHNNPVRALVVATAADSTWTSHRAYVGAVAAPEWLCVADGLARSGFANPSDFDRWTSDPTREGDESFSADLVDQDTPSRGAPGIPRTRPLPAEAMEIVRMSAAALDLPLSQLRSPRKGPKERAARRVAIRCAFAVGLTGVEIAFALGVTQQGVSAISRRGDDTDETEAVAQHVLSRLAKKLCE